MAIVQVRRFENDTVYGVHEVDAVINTESIRAIEPIDDYFVIEMIDGQRVTVDRQGVQRLVRAHSHELNGKT